MEWYACTVDRIRGGVLGLPGSPSKATHYIPLFHAIVTMKRLVNREDVVRVYGEEYARLLESCPNLVFVDKGEALAA
jgi:hypothetical protein